MESEERQQREVARALPDTMCAPGSYYLECFDLGVELCRETMHDLVTTCLYAYKNERHTFHITPGQTFRDVMIECIRTPFEIRGVLFFRGSERCLNRSAWPSP
jgi:hypothetical protein